MNRLVSTNLESIRTDLLPPEQPYERARVLFMTSFALGFVNLYDQLARITERCDEIDAVHIKIISPIWMKILGKSIPLLPTGWDFHAFRHTMMWQPLMRRWFARHLPLSRFDLVFITTQDLALAVPHLKRLYDIPFVVNIDTTASANMREFKLARFPVYPFFITERRIFPVCDLVVSMNQWAADSLRADYGLPAERTHVARTSITLPPVPAKHDGGERLPRMLFVGNDWRRKGGPKLLHMHQQRFRDRAELHVCSAGVQPDTSARNVVWHGSVPHEQLMSEVFPSMDFFVMPTRQDMVPWAILEAASFGLPVISTAMAAIPEIVLHETSGVLCELNRWDQFSQAIDRLIADPELRRSMGRAARQHISTHFNPDIEYGNLIKRLLQLVRSPGAPCD